MNTTPISPSIQKELGPFIEKMVKEQTLNGSIHNLVIQKFSELYTKLRSGEKLKFNETDIVGLDPEDPRCISFSNCDAFLDVGTAHLSQTIVLKLNGGLGTSMGCTSAKSTITIDRTHNQTFLDIILLQVQSLNQTYQTKIPLWFMNSFNTASDTRKQLDPTTYHEFLQNKFPKINIQNPDSPTPFSDPAHPENEWNPPGHGDLYTAMELTGWIDQQLQSGFSHVFISNADNLGATLDPRILGLMISKKIDFLMETTPKTPADIKGGSLIRIHTHLKLLEKAQVADTPQAMDQFMQLPIFNTNSIWIHLPALKAIIQRNALNLPLIRNDKRINDIPVIQLECAMGAAIECFEHAATLIVPRDRFIPVKNTSDLLLLSSDYFTKTNAGIVQAAAANQSQPIISLSPPYFNTISEYEKRIPFPPSLKNIHTLTLIGDITLGEKIILCGRVDIQIDPPYTCKIEDQITLNNISIKNNQILSNNGPPVKIIASNHHLVIKNM